MSRRSRRASTHRYPRTARLNVLLREIVAEELGRVDDDRLELVTVTGVEVDSDLSRAIVYFSALGDSGDDEIVLGVLDEHRRGLHKAINAQARLRRIPKIEFRIDPAIRGGARIDEILADLERSGELGRDDRDDVAEGTGDDLDAES